MNYEDNPISIKYYVKKYLIENSSKLINKTIVDFPAGNGITSKIIKQIGAVPLAFDLFPEYFSQDGIECVRANVKDGLPIVDKSADVLICQEGIEHFSDQYGTLREFNRVLRDGGVLIITTPNYSNLRSKLSYLLSESERYNSTMPPNELDSVWMTNQNITSEIYFGHIFLIGIQKLRVLSKLAGFKIHKIHYTKIKNTSLLLLPILYPLIVVSNWISYRKNMKKNINFDSLTKKNTYSEQFKIAINPRILISSHIMVEFTKEVDANLVASKLVSMHNEFGLT